MTEYEDYEGSKYLCRSRGERFTILPSTRFTKETAGKEILGLAQGGGHLEQFLYRNVLIAVTVYRRKRGVLKGLAHEIDLSFDDITCMPWSVLGLNRGRSQVLNFSDAPMML